MSTALLPDALTLARLGASQRVEALPGAPFQMAQGKVYPSMYPLPGSSRPPLTSPRNVTLPAFTSFAPGVYHAGDVYNVPNYQCHSAVYHPAGFIPPTENPAPPMNDAGFRAPRYPLCYMPVGAAAGTTPLLSLEDTGYHEQSAQFTFQCPLPAQPDATPAQEQQDQHHRTQVAEEDSAVEESLMRPGEDYHSSEASHAALVEPEVRLYTDHGYNHSHPLAKNILPAFVGEYPDALSPEQVACLVATIAPDLNVEKSTAGRRSTDDPLPNQHEAERWETASSGSSTTASTSTSEHSSPSGSFLCPPKHFEAESSSMGTIGSLTGKRQRSGDCPEHRPVKQRPDGCTDTVRLTVCHTFRLLIHQPQQGHPEGHCEPCNSRILEDREKHRKKKKKNSDEGEFICIFCVILGTPHRP